MAKQCPSCQQLLDEGARFCPICGTQVTDVKPTDAPIELLPEQLPPPLIEAPSSSREEPPPVRAAPIGSPAGSEVGLVKPALMAGIIMGSLSALPLVSCCCLVWVCGGGILAVYFLRNETKGEITVGKGAQLGFLAGMFGTVTWQLIELPLSLLFGQEGLERVREIFEQAGNMPAETMQMIDQMIGLFSNPFHPLVILLGLLSKAVLCAVLTTVGGILGVAFFGKHKA
ncbi:MAG: zinc ribbon domain-containing protein [Acidobacteriota bacterium]